MSNSSHSATTPNDPLGASDTSSSLSLLFSSVVESKLKDNDGGLPECQEPRN